MTDSNITNLLNNEEEEEKKKIETPETDALFQRFDNQPLSAVSKVINKSIECDIKRYRQDKSNTST